MQEVGTTLVLFDTMSVRLKKNSTLGVLFYVVRQDENDSEPKTFEELCRAHIRSFAKGAQAYAAETKLSKRVGDWHNRLVPILEEEENRPAFDIHAYTRRVVNAIEEESERLLIETGGLAKVSFVKSKSKYICFDLSDLHLCLCSQCLRTGL